MLTVLDTTHVWKSSRNVLKKKSLVLLVVHPAELASNVVCWSSTLKLASTWNVPAVRSSVSFVWKRSKMEIIHVDRLIPNVKSPLFKHKFLVQINGDFCNCTAQHIHTVGYCHWLENAKKFEPSITNWIILRLVYWLLLCTIVSIDLKTTVVSRSVVIIWTIQRILIIVTIRSFCYISNIWNIYIYIYILCNFKIDG